MDWINLNKAKPPSFQVVEIKCKSNGRNSDVVFYYYDMVYNKETNRWLVLESYDRGFIYTIPKHRFYYYWRLIDLKLDYVI